MALSRNEDILQAIVNGTSSSELPSPQSREERLLHAILDKLNTGAGGSGTGLSIHICSANEYDAITGVPIIENPSETTFYLVPTGDGANDIYDEWVYVEGAWEKFGSGSHVTSGTTYAFSEGDVNGAFLVEDSDGQRQSVKVHGLLPFCFSDNDEVIIFDSGSIDD